MQVYRFLDNMTAYSLSVDKAVEKQRKSAKTAVINKIHHWYDYSE